MMYIVMLFDYNTNDWLIVLRGKNKRQAERLAAKHKNYGHRVWLKVVEV